MSKIVANKYAEGVFIKLLTRRERRIPKRGKSLIRQEHGRGLESLISNKWRMPQNITEGWEP